MFFIWLISSAENCQENISGESDFLAPLPLGDSLPAEKPGRERPEIQTTLRLLGEE
jgi:hypothetical protein